jgi:hypothetical protein
VDGLPVEDDLSYDLRVIGEECEQFLEVRVWWHGLALFSVSEAGTVSFTQV